MNSEIMKTVDMLVQLSSTGKTKKKTVEKEVPEKVQA